MEDNPKINDENRIRFNEDEEVLSLPKNIIQPKNIEYRHNHGK